MSFHHACPFCEWSRAATHRTVLDPCCPRCGGLLEAIEIDPHATPRRVHWAALTRSRRFDAVVAAIFVLPVLLTAGKIGGAHGGVAGGIGAVVLAALAASVALSPSRPVR